VKITTFLVLLLAALSAPIGNAVAGTFTSRTVTVGVRKNMEATLYTPEGPGPFPMVLVMHTSGGIQEADRGYCANLAKEGYICIAPAFLRAHGITSPELRRKAFTTEARAIYDDFVEIIGELNVLPKARQGAVGAVGFSNGGYFAALLAATRRVKAAVSYYGAFDGALTQKDLKPMRERFTSASSPFLILAGENDSTIGMQPVRLMEEILKSCGAPFELKVYPNTGHDFDRSAGLPGNGAAAADAWPRTLAFLRANGV